MLKLIDNSVWELGANVTLTGLVIVFLALILLVVILSIFSGVFGRVGKKKAAPRPVETPPAVYNAPAPAPAASDGVGDEIVAVIAAAVEYAYSGTGKKPVIKSVMPSKKDRSAWGAAGVADNTRAF